MKYLAKFGKADQYSKLVKIMKSDFEKGITKIQASGKGM